MNLAFCCVVRASHILDEVKEIIPEDLRVESDVANRFILVDRACSRVLNTV